MTTTSVMSVLPCLLYNSAVRVHLRTIFWHTEEVVLQVHFREEHF